MYNKVFTVLLPAFAKQSWLVDVYVYVYPSSLAQFNTSIYTFIGLFPLLQFLKLDLQRNLPFGFFRKEKSFLYLALNYANYISLFRNNGLNSLHFQITLYKDNRPILKAECGITLGLLKLIYSTDDAYSGILLGVKPRLLNGELPCLVTFDNTSLTHPEYDLIVQGNFCYLTNQTK